MRGSGYACRAGLGAGLLLALVQIGLPAAHAAQARTVSYYTTEQAQRGETTYQQFCAVCHGASLAGAFDVPPLKGRFVTNWSGATLDRLFDYISKAMPLFSPGALTPAQNADLVAFILRENGVPAGRTELPATDAALKTMVFPTISADRVK
ncbi:c-type cytochrome [Komagataeibacter diospyri]|uniref:Cytochrome c n=1 Tax=Komagataeibacter diospyri TaxID=1932662 RepID=A0A4P5NLD5_9PROT|nr:cytochrome c [Komagataeibacter diospyri]GCE82289.1 cytochrome c [Komagataeibacter diospyri]